MSLGTSTLQRIRSSGFKYGAFENAERAKRFRDGEDIIFFWSRDRKTNFFVGLYAKPYLLNRYDVVCGASRSVQFNVKVGLDPEHLICPFEVFLESVRGRHLKDGGKTKQSPGRICFCYIDNDAARNIVNDACARNPMNRYLEHIKNEYDF